MHVMNLLKKQAIRVLPVMERRKLVGIITDGALQISLRNHRHGSGLSVQKGQLSLPVLHTPQYLLAKPKHKPLCPGMTPFWPSLYNFSPIFFRALTCFAVICEDPLISDFCENILHNFSKFGCEAELLASGNQPNLLNLW